MIMSTLHGPLHTVKNLLHMELDLQSLFGQLGSYVQLYSFAEIPQPHPPPRIWAHIQGRYWSAKIDDISL